MKDSFRPGVAAPLWRLQSEDRAAAIDAIVVGASIIGAAVQCAACIDGQAGFGVLAIVRLTLEIVDDGFCPRAAGMERRRESEHRATGVGTSAAAAINRCSIERAIPIENEIAHRPGAVAARLIEAAGEIVQYGFGPLSPLRPWRRKRVHYPL